MVRGGRGGALRERLGSGALALALSLLAAATGADLLGSLTGLRALWIAGADLGTLGVVAGAFAVGLRLPALLRASRGRAARFAALALPGLALFAVARWVRGDAAIPPDPAVLLAEPVALLLLWLARRATR